MRHLSTILPVLCLVATPTAVFAQPAPPDTAALSREAGGLIQAFGGRMLKELQEAMQSGGPANAIKVCNTSAPGIAKEESAKSGWKIGRTALRIRNTANAPDEFERKTLEEFAAKAAGGADLATLARAEVVTENGKKAFRFIKAIPLGDRCIDCHGSDIKPELKAVLAQHYPQDTATGFKIGDLRGVFTLTKPLP